MDAPDADECRYEMSTSCVAMNTQVIGEEGSKVHNFPQIGMHFQTILGQ